MPRINIKPEMNMNKKAVLGRLLKYLFKSYPIHFVISLICIVITSIGSIAASIFMTRFIDDVIYKGIEFGFDDVQPTLVMLIVSLASVYVTALIASTLYQQLLCVVTQGFLDKVRTDMFSKMEKLPISYFDRNQHGDIMSTYTNDVDAIRQVVSQSLPQFVQVMLTVLMLFGVMLYYSIWLSLVVIGAVILIYI